MNQEYMYIVTYGDSERVYFLSESNARARYELQARTGTSVLERAFDGNECHETTLIAFHYGDR